MHTPVMVASVLEALKPRPDGFYADGTLGGAGHAAAILAASSPTGRLFGCDRDGTAVERARARLAEYAGRFELRQGNYAELVDWLPAESCDGIFLDLGISSWQLDDAERGFGFMRDGPLDMRMNPEQGMRAADLVNEADEQELARIFWEFGDERDSRRFARGIVRERASRRFETTGQLAACIERMSPRRGRTHPATKVFQSLRVAVNDELGSLERGLVGALKVLKVGGRLAVLSFQGSEAALVKNFGRARARDYTFGGGSDVPELRVPRAPELRLVSRKAQMPEAAEMDANPRSRSAQLRVMEKLRSV